MPLERIYIARHGFRLNWQNGGWMTPTGLARDIPLTAYGEVQAGILAQHFLSMPENERPTAIFSSAWYRCLQTSEPVARALGIDVYVEQGIGEWFSPAAPGSGLHPRPGSVDSLKQHSPHIDHRYKVTWLPSRRGESVAEIHGRVASFLRAFFGRLDLAALGAPVASDAELDLGRHKNILFVGHAASVIVMARELVGDRHLAMRAGCCSLSTLVPKLGAERSSYSLTPSLLAFPDKDRTLSNAGVGQWDLIVNATAHFLPNGAERDWGFEDIEVAAGEVVNDIGERGTEDMSEGPTEQGLQVELPPELLPAGPSSLVVNSPSRTLRL